MRVENFSLAGKSALVTGGSRGIGAACAKLLGAPAASYMTGPQTLIDGGMLA